MFMCLSFYLTCMNGLRRMKYHNSKLDVDVDRIVFIFIADGEGKDCHFMNMNILAFMPSILII